MDLSRAGTVITLAGEVTVPNLALILIGFAASLMTVARPLLLIVTRTAFEVVQVTKGVTFAVDPLL